MSSGRVPDSFPLGAFPTAVRTAETITAFINHLGQIRCQSGKSGSDGSIPYFSGVVWVVKNMGLTRQTPISHCQFRNTFPFFNKCSIRARVFGSPHNDLNASRSR